MRCQAGDAIAGEVFVRVLCSAFCNELWMMPSADCSSEPRYLEAYSYVSSVLREQLSKL